METCEHEWMKTHEQTLLGSIHFPTGYQCQKCNKFVSISELDPTGLPGKVTKKHKLVGPNNGSIVGASKPCKFQVVDLETGKIEYFN